MTKSTHTSLMQTRQLTVRFLTPAFLGNAEQDGQWRTPPFKHLLRAWWRVAWAEANDWSNDYRAMRRQEGELFGSAAGSSGHRSRVRVRLSKWCRGICEEWRRDLKVFHKEVGNGGREVGALLYLGYGPLVYDKGAQKTRLKANAAIQAGESAELRLAFPATDADLIDRSLALIDAFGTLGGRSRNGWGSVSLEGAPALDTLPLRDWRDCLDRDWPHAIGRDGQGALIWLTEPFDDWQTLMRRLAEIKIGLRTQFTFHTGRNARRPEERHWLSYPVTNHNVRSWGRNRLPNSLRFKAEQDANGKLRGRIFHVPSKPPSQFRPDIQTIERVWEQVHAYLDSNLDREGLR